MQPQNAASPHQAALAGEPEPQVVVVLGPDDENLPSDPELDDILADIRGDVEKKKEWDDLMSRPCVGRLDADLEAMKSKLEVLKTQLLPKCAPIQKEQRPMAAAASMLRQTASC
ncbi:hypothetical protein PAPYR_4273 [Paratrimastix pyriformis]|uniref:Uncharacterized protein n=1 Tax=Paratrimastix pyriformis TaxID=342808 RepID=A0ABQ8UPB9_9EUKA|nr:hypothetical protein PAPYR_4273 [Paratrimastix pyriformis]